MEEAARLESTQTTAVTDGLTSSQKNALYERFRAVLESPAALLPNTTCPSDEFFADATLAVAGQFYSVPADQTENLRHTITFLAAKIRERKPAAAAGADPGPASDAEPSEDAAASLINRTCMAIVMMFALLVKKGAAQHKVGWGGDESSAIFYQAISAELSRRAGEAPASQGQAAE